MPDSTCFACARGLPEDGSPPRFLCGPHKAGCRLADGTLLSEALQLVANAHGPAEGSALAVVYNPVCVTTVANSEVRGWTDFSGGGMAVYEDRFGAATPFEFWALEGSDAVALLCVLRRHHGGEMPDSWFALTRPLSQSQRALLDLAWILWQSGRHVSALRAGGARHWPRSFDELAEWLEPATPLPAAGDPAHTPVFARLLSALAARRFPDAATAV